MRGSFRFQHLLKPIMLTLKVKEGKKQGRKEIGEREEGKEGRKEGGTGIRFV